MATDTLSHVRKHWTRLLENSPIYKFLLHDIDIVSASSSGVVTARLKVRQEHLNSKGTLHGTVSACLTDWAGGLAVASTGLETTGVSTDIHTTYISTAKLGDVLEITGRASKVGGSLAFTTIEIVKVGGEGQAEGQGERRVVCNGTHTKYVRR